MRKLTILLVLLLLGGLQVVLAQKTITGKVTSKEDGSSIPGATVVVSGTTSGTTTDIDGKFTLNVPANALTLHVTFIGMKPIDVEIGTSKEIFISLESEAVSLDEVVVVGYGTQKKRDLTGAITSVKANDILVSSNPDIGHSLQGKAAGLMVRENSAQPGGGLDIFIRGAGSILASNAPLYVVDGFPISDLQQPGSGNRYDAGTQSVLNTFNPNDIASIEVLKDASATSIYGARAAHGVILITTKRGLEGKPVVQYSTSYAFQKYNNSFDVMPLDEWMQVRNEAKWEDYLYQNHVEPWGPKTLADFQASDEYEFHNMYTQNAINNVGKGTDWLGLATRDGAIQQHNISVSGGNKTTKFMVSGNYYDHQGVVKNSGFQRYTVRGNVDQALSKYVKLGVDFSFSRINNKNSTLGDQPWENSGIIRASIQQGPHILAIDEEGHYPLNPQLSQQPNPYSLLTITDNGRIERTMVNSFLDITPVTGLVVRLKAGLDRGITNRWTYLPQTTLAGETEHGKASISENDHNGYLLEATANYTKTLGDDHNFNLLAGVSEEKSVDQSNSSGNSGFITDAFLWNNLGSGSGTKAVSSSGSEDHIASYFGRLNYIFKDKYYVTGTLRTDGASVFGANNKWATFPSVALGWNIANESFFGNLKNTVSQLKLRFSYGQTGNASIGSNAFAAYGAYLAYLSGNEDVKNIGVSLTRLDSPDLRWETTTEANLGVDFSMFKDRVNGSLELYSRVISDLLAFKPINSYHDVNRVAYNVGETQSRGFEFTLVTRNVVKNDFQWKTTLSFSKFKDKWLKRADDWKPNVYESDNDPIRPLFYRESDGIMQIGEVVPTQPNLLPGSVKIKDINGFKRDANGNPMVDDNGRFLRTGAPDGMIDDADTRLIGTSDPSLMAGLGNSITYKNLTLDFFFNGMFGRQLADPNYLEYGVSAEGIYTYGYNGLRTVKDRWTPTNPSTTHPSSYNGWGTNYGSGDFFLQKAWFVRLQNISLGYKLPQKWFHGVLQDAQVHFDAQNLFVITPYTGVDPETDSYTAAYPNVKTYTLGLNITF